MNPDYISVPSLVDFRLLYSLELTMRFLLPEGIGGAYREFTRARTGEPVSLFSIDHFYKVRSLRKELEVKVDRTFRPSPMDVRSSGSKMTGVSSLHRPGRKAVLIFHSHHFVSFFASSATPPPHFIV